MTIRDAYGAGRFGLSFELFPPKTPEGMSGLLACVRDLAAFDPSYITCTYGAGGSTQQRTLEVITRVREEYGVPVATHLTCVGLTAAEIREYLTRAISQGVENVVALRGDPPRGQTEFQPVAGGFAYANELVALIRNEFAQMGVAVGGYPEKHQEAPSFEVDLENLKRKVDAGADVVITQLFYNNDDFYRFRDRCGKLGINVPIVPGVLPVTNGAQIQRIAALCGAKLPAPFAAELERSREELQIANAGARATPAERLLAGVASVAALTFALAWAPPLLGGGVGATAMGHTIFLSFATSVLAGLGWLALVQRRRDVDTAFWSKVWTGPVGKALFGLGRRTLGRAAPANAVTHRATELSLGLAGGELFESLPRATRDALGDVPRVLQRLQELSLIHI